MLNQPVVSTQDGVDYGSAYLCSSQPSVIVELRVARHNRPPFIRKRLLSRQYTPHQGQGAAY
jgi:hypothetical protein